jgi:hypothetical protein
MVLGNRSRNAPWQFHVGKEQNDKPGLWFGNIKTPLDSNMYVHLHLLTEQFGFEGDNRSFPKEGVKAYLMTSMSPNI